MIPEGSKVTMTAGPDTYEYTAGKPLPANKAPRPEGPFTIGHGNWFVTPDVREHYGDELLDQINQRGGTPIMPPGMKQVHLQKPSVGRIVHYHPHGEEGPYAAIITAVAQDPKDIRVSLNVFDPDGMFYAHKVSYSVSTGGCWSWPPRA